MFPTVPDGGPVKLNRCLARALQILVPAHIRCGKSGGVASWAPFWGQSTITRFVTPIVGQPSLASFGRRLAARRKLLRDNFRVVDYPWRCSLETLARRAARQFSRPCGPVKQHPLNNNSLRFCLPEWTPHLIFEFALALSVDAKQGQSASSRANSRNASHSRRRAVSRSIVSGSSGNAACGEGLRQATL